MPHDAWSDEREVDEDIDFWAMPKNDHAHWRLLCGNVQGPIGYRASVQVWWALKCLKKGPRKALHAKLTRAAARNPDACDRARWQSLLKEW